MKLNVIVFVCFGLLLLGCQDQSERNLPPVIEDQIFSVSYEQKTEFSIQAKDPENESLSFSLKTLNTEGSLLHLGGNKFSFESSSGQFDTVYLEVIVSDGELSTTAQIELIIEDNRPFELLNSENSLKDKPIAIDQFIAFEFNSVISNTINLNQNLQCNSDISLSIDNFKTCIDFDAEFSQNRHQIQIKPLAPLNFSTRYKIRFSQNLKSQFGNALANDLELDLITEYENISLNEVKLSEFDSDLRWIELINNTSELVNLQDIKIQTKAISLLDYELIDFSFSLPKQILKPNEIIVIENDHFEGDWQNGKEANGQRILITGEHRMHWANTGVIKLFDDKRQLVIDTLEFNQNASIAPNNKENFKVSAQGGSYLVAKNKWDNQLVWQQSAFPTQAAKNDVLCEIDNDKDGIPDCNEAEGTTFSGLPLYEWGARPEQTDVFVEVDYMASDDEALKPHLAALFMVENAFANNNVKIHFDSGSLHGNEYNLNGGAEVPFNKTTHFNKINGSPSVLTYKSRYFDLARNNIFHYLLFANSQLDDGTAGSSGYAEINGDDVIITLGGWGLNSTNSESLNYLVNIQASTIMHELGHNFGLNHGGADYTNNKPNHLSVMNYLYQLSGLPEIGNNEGDRFLSSAYMPDAQCNEFISLTNGPWQDYLMFKIDYSHGLSQPMFESAIEEYVGFGQLGSGAIDFNCNGQIDNTAVSLDLDQNSWFDDILYDYNEWSLLKFDYLQISSPPWPFKAKKANITRDFNEPELAPSKHLLQLIQAAKH